MAIEKVERKNDGLLLRYFFGLAFYCPTSEELSTIIGFGD
jgi:hypothetical protein